MNRHLYLGLTASAILAACATPYDPKQHRNIESLEQAPPTLDELLPPVATPSPPPQSSARATPRPTEGLADVEKTKKAIENYRQILELSPNDRAIKWEAQRRLADFQSTRTTRAPRSFER